MSDYESAHFGGSDEDGWLDGGQVTEPPPAQPSVQPQVVTSSSAPAHAAQSAAAAPRPPTDQETGVERPAAPAPETSGQQHVSIELTDEQCRIMGALIEKSFLTPDIYPMTTNAIATACNQKTNRDPVVSYSAVQIDSQLMELRERSLVRRVHVPGSRSTKHRHTLDEALSLDANELAVMSVLMLRGAQTVGELRLRTERHVDFPDLEATDACLEGLAARSTPLVRQLARQPGQKEARWQHLISDPDSMAAPVSDGETFETAAASTTAPAPAQAPAEPQPGTADLHARVQSLESEVETLRRQLQSLAEQLGESLE